LTHFIKNHNSSKGSRGTVDLVNFSAVKNKKKNVEKLVKDILDFLKKKQAESFKVDFLSMKKLVAGS
jgi:hypothetical protein